MNGPSLRSPLLGITVASLVASGWLALAAAGRASGTAGVAPDPCAGASTSDVDKKTILWSLTYFLSSRLDSESATSGRSTRVPELVTALNELYGAANAPVASLAGGGNLLLKGTDRQLCEITRFLARIDSPWPQVQMTLWALQISGTPERITKKLDALNSDVRDTREALITVQRELAHRVRPTLPEGRKPTVDDFQGCTKELFRAVACRRSPIFLPFSGPLSLNESLVLLAVDADRKTILTGFQEWVEGRFKTQVAALPGGHHPFRRLEELLSTSDRRTDCEPFQNFLTALEDYDRGGLGSPEAVVRTGTILDRLLKDTMDAYAADMSELFLGPLLAEAQSDSTGGPADGVSLMGRSRIVVTSGLTSGLTPTMSSPVEISRPKSFTADLLDKAFPTKKGGDPAAIGANRILAALPQSQALLLAAALSEPEARFATVAPGVKVKIRPSVLPDGAAARLTIDATFGVTTSPLDTNASPDTRNDPPAPAIQQHRVETDATVGVFDLFDISSFSMTTSHPRTPFYVPILGRLPIIGPAFQWPRRPKEIHHESVILVNTVVLPRALNLSSFYRLSSLEAENLPDKPASCQALPVPP
jgi:hypothetical protein